MFPSLGAAPRQLGGLSRPLLPHNQKMAKHSATKNPAPARSQRKPLPPIMALAAAAHHTGGKLKGASAKRFHFNIEEIWARESPNSCKYPCILPQPLDLSHATARRAPITWSGSSPDFWARENHGINSTWALALKESVHSVRGYLLSL